MTRPPWLTVVGVGADGLAGLGARGREAVAAAEALVGGVRHLAMVSEDGRERVAWRSPLAATLADLERMRGRAVVVLASGDPLWFGVGRLLLARFGPGEVRVVPHASAFQEAAARLGWPLEGVVATSVHGRPLDRLRRHLAPGRRLLVLCEDGGTPAAAAVLLRGSRLGQSRLWVLEELAGPRERVVEDTAEGLGPGRFADLCTLAVEVAGDAAGLPVGTVLPDEAFAHDGQLTKREVRALTLAALAPLPGELLWDVGAGSGAVAIDWLRADPSLRAVGVERDEGRAARARANAAALGVPELDMVVGEAPACLPALPGPPPDAVFVGGGVGEPEMLEACWARLRPDGGRLVANAVTLAGEAAVLAFHARNGGRLVRVALARAEPLGGGLVWRPALPVTQLVARKPAGCAAES